MRRPVPELNLIPAESLLPKEWWRGVDPAACYLFNPSIAEHGGQRILAFRVVLPDMVRRVAMCRLDERFRVIDGSVVPLSDLLVDGGDWHADPRMCSFGDRLLLHFNSGARKPNDIFLVELDPDTLRPIGRCCPLLLGHPRAPVEKNWMFFAHDDVLYAVYSIVPHRVLRVDLNGSGPVRCTSVHCTGWDAGALVVNHGEPRGSTPPVRIGDSFHSFFHTRYQRPFARRVIGALRGFSLESFTYGTGAYRFRAAPPFEPESFTPELLFEPPMRPQSPRPSLACWNDSAIYASGAVLEGAEWVVSAGFHDDGCVLMRFRDRDLLNAMREAGRNPAAA